MSTASGGSGSPGKMRAAVAASTLVLLALTIPLLVVFVLGLFVQPTASALPNVQSAPSVTIQTVLTVAPGTETTPTATVKSGSGGGDGSGQLSPTATPRAAPTATPVPPTPIPTVPISGG